MKKYRKLLGLVLLIVLNISGLMPHQSVSSQSTDNSAEAMLEYIWTVPNDICGQEYCNLLFRSDGESLFVLSLNTHEFYALGRSQPIATYSLNEIFSEIIFNLDFAIINPNEVLISAQTSSGYDFFKYNLHERTLITVELSGLPMTPCDWQIIFPLHHFSYFSSTKKILACSNQSLYMIDVDNSDNNKDLINLSQTRSVGRAKPWVRLFAGQDGLIYVQMADREAFDETLPELDIATQVHNQNLLVYLPSEEQWNLLSVEEDNFRAVLNIEHTETTHLVGVDSNSNLYFHLVFDDGELTTGRNIIKTDSQGILLWNLDTSNLNDFIYFQDFIGEDKILMAKSGDSVSEVAIVNIIEP